MDPIYLDYNASTPIDPRVRRAMQPFLEAGFGNPSSAHWAGRPAREAVEKARSQVAGLLGCTPEEILFTSGGTEASNHAIKGTYYHALLSGGLERSGAEGPPHFISTQVEHPATLNPLRFLERLGAEVTLLPVDRMGRITAGQVERALLPRTLLVSIMHANNEVGTIQPVEEISEVTRARGVPFHTDAAQSLGKIPVRVDSLGVDLLSVAGHKLYAPKGVGALYVRRGTLLEPLVHGAGHESGRRAGTENVLLIVGLGEASRIAAEELEGVHRIRELRDFFHREMSDSFGSAVTFNLHPQSCLPNTLSVNFVGRLGSEVLDALGDVAASTGSACHSGSVTLSPVLQAMGVPPEEGLGAVRFSLGRGTTREEILTVLDRLRSVLRG